MPPTTAPSTARTSYPGPTSRERTGTIVPPPDAAHAFGAPLRSSTTTSAARPPRSQTVPRATGYTENPSKATTSPAYPTHQFGIASIYLQGVDNAEIIATVHTRRAPMVPASTRLRL